MPILPGGQIIGGVGGRIWTQDFPIPWQQIQSILFSSSLSPDSGSYDIGIDGLDVAEWRLSIRTNLAQCPHTGTFGANCRRIVLNDWSFSASVPLDQLNPPDFILSANALVNPPMTTKGQNISIAFKLGDVQINSEAAFMEMDQSWYYAPSAYLQAANPVLNAAGDVIRMSFSGEGCGHIFLLTEGDNNDDKGWLNNYIAYLENRGWWIDQDE